MYVKMIIEQVKEHFKLVLGVALVLILVVFFYLRNTRNDIEGTVVLTDKSAMTPKVEKSTVKQSSESQKSETKQHIMVDIKGAVKKPAVYQVDSHARVGDVIALAGGMTSQADSKSVNLAQKVTDEMIIYVASIGENITVIPSATADKTTNEQGKSVTAASDKVNINTADMTQLQSLTGIGAKKAQDIIDYREQNGPFKTPEDLANVSGFGEKTIEKLMGDLLAVVNQIKVKNILTSEGSLNHTKFIKLLKKTGANIMVAHAGQRLKIFDRYLEVLYPLTPGDGKNNDSIVLYGELYGKNFLFTGDLEEPGERALLAHYPSLTVDVLKVGHHGSKTSSSEPFIKAINPSIALISCGLDNRYGHPNTETLTTFRTYGIQTFRTDESGAIKFEKNSKSWHISTVK